MQVLSIERPIKKKLHTRIGHELSNLVVIFGHLPTSYEPQRRLVEAQSIDNAHGKLGKAPPVFSDGNLAF